MFKQRQTYQGGGFLKLHHSPTTVSLLKMRLI